MVGDLPSDWRMLPLEQCMTAIIDYRGKTPRKTSFGIPLVTAKVVKAGRIETPDEFIATEDYDEWMRRGLPEANDVVMTTEAPLGEIAQLDGRRVALAQRLITLRGMPDLLNNTFLKFLMQSFSVQEQLKARATGTTVLGIKQSELRKVLLVIPPLREQESIAHMLGTLDDKIELNRRMNETLEAMARALFKSWFVDFDPVRAKMDGRQPEGMDKATADLFPDSFEDSPLGKIPKGWKVGPILNEAALLSGGTPSTSNPSFWDGGIPWASAKDVSQCNATFLVTTERTITSKGLENSSTKLIEPFSTVVVARDATTGRMTMFGRPIAMNQTCYGFRCRSDAHFFLYCHVRQVVGHLVHSAHGSVFDTITTRTFETTPVVIPCRAVSRRFHDAVAPIFGQILSNLKEALTLAALRDALLPKLLSGEIRVPEAERLVESRP